MGSMRDLNLEQLAHESEAAPGLIHDLVRVGVLKPGRGGSFSSRDIVRVRIAQAMLDAGLALDVLERGLAEQLLSFDHIDAFYHEPAPRSRRTYAEFRETLGDGAADTGAVYAAFGLAEPALDSHLPANEEEVIEAFLQTWGRVVDREALRRAARINGEPIRRLTEAVTALCYEALTAPYRDKDLPLDELIRLTAEPAARMAALQPPLIVWLEQRHSEHAVNRINFTEIERALIERGWTPPRSVEPPAIAFVDLSGFTSMTEQRGDELAARLAGRLQELAESAARTHGGRVIKLLGDGVMLRFDRPGNAVEASLDMVAAAPSADLPMAHAGIHAGPLIERDGDFYGHTVNLAARIVSAADAGQVVVSQAVIDGVADGSVHFEPLATVPLKGVTQPVALFLASRRAP